MQGESRHKVFISYHHENQNAVDGFVRTFDQDRRVMISRIVGGSMASDIEINSSNTDYVMRRIRALYLSDSTVTIVMVGAATWKRKYVDWEIASSLRQGPEVGLPNGLIGVLVPGITEARLPDRFKDNWDRDDTGYARFYQYPKSKMQLRNWIEEAFGARTSRAQMITNGRLLRQRNSPAQ